jgi:hypothetical protein
MRSKLKEPNGVDERNKTMKKTEYDNYRKSLIHNYWMYQEANFQPWDKYLDRPNNDDRRPPVFLEKNWNVITNPESSSGEKQKLFGMIKSGEHHK